MVLLILAGITIAYVLGENSIFKKASEAKIRTEQAAMLEIMRQYAYVQQIEGKTENADYINYFMTKNMIDANNVVNLDNVTKNADNTINDFIETEENPSIKLAAEKNKEYHIIIDGIEITDITIPNHVTQINARALEQFVALTNINLSTKVTQIGAYAFRSCKSLTNITIPQGVTSIGQCAFGNCIALTSITIPQEVMSIYSAFEGWSSEQTIYIEGKSSVNDFNHLNAGAFGNATVKFLGQ